MKNMKAKKAPTMPTKANTENIDALSKKRLVWPCAWPLAAMPANAIMCAPHLQKVVTRMVSSFQRYAMKFAMAYKATTWMNEISSLAHGNASAISNVTMNWVKVLNHNTAKKIDVKVSIIFKVNSWTRPGVSAIETTIGNKITEASRPMATECASSEAAAWPPFALPWSPWPAASTCSPPWPEAPCAAACPPIRFCASGPAAAAA
mmetsp:Transcript_173784/g.556973  ORF Transcript_173784/g.556973 Transcript_173784/m.556973 type:complete len:205 (+) Transcript_173784:859-1473(+)